MLFVVASINQHRLVTGKEAPSLGPKRDYALDQDIFEILVGDSYMRAKLPPRMTALVLVSEKPQR